MLLSVSVPDRKTTHFTHIFWRYSVTVFKTTCLLCNIFIVCSYDHIFDLLSFFYNCANCFSWDILQFFVIWKCMKYIFVSKSKVSVRAMVILACHFTESSHINQLCLNSWLYSSVRCCREYEVAASYEASSAIPITSSIFNLSFYYLTL